MNQVLTVAVSVLALSTVAATIATKNINRPAAGAPQVEFVERQQVEQYLSRSLYSAVMTVDRYLRTLYWENRFEYPGANPGANPGARGAHARSGAYPRSGPRRAAPSQWKPAARPARQATAAGTERQAAAAWLEQAASPRMEQRKGQHRSAGASEETTVRSSLNA